MKNKILLLAAFLSAFGCSTPDSTLLSKAPKQQSESQEEISDDTEEPISETEKVYQLQDKQMAEAAKVEEERRKAEELKKLEESKARSEKLSAEYKAYQRNLKQKFKINDQELELELIRGDYVGGIGLSLGETLFRLYTSKELYKFSESTMRNPIGKHLVIKALSTRTHKKFTIHFIITKENALLQSASVEQVSLSNSEALVALMMIFQGER